MATNDNQQEINRISDIKAKLHEDIELNNLFLDMIDYPMSLCEEQIMHLNNADFPEENRYLDIEVKSFITPAEKVRKVVQVWKELEIISRFIDNALYANYFKFYEDLSDDDYNILAIKYIVKNKLI